jgi:hypothetical protein
MSEKNFEFFWPQMSKFIAQYIKTCKHFKLLRFMISAKERNGFPALNFKLSNLTKL